MSPARSLSRGLIAGAVGTSALNAVTYADMVLRGRGESSTPEQTVERAVDLVGLEIPGDDDARQARRSGCGALLGIAAGLGAGVALGLMRGAGRPRGRLSTPMMAWVLAMMAGNVPMTALGVTDPRTWSAQSWAADIVPHAAYALAAAATFEAFDA